MEFYVETWGAKGITSGTNYLLYYQQHKSMFGTCVKSQEEHLAFIMQQT